MSNILTQLIDNNNIESQTIIYGQIFITSSNTYRKVYYDSSTNIRNEITNSCKFYTDYDAITEARYSIILNKLYIDLSTLKMYGVINDEFVEITTTNDLETIINNVDDYKVGIAYKDGKLATVISTENQVLTDTGLTFSDSIDETKLLTVIRVKFLYVTIKVDNTKSIYLPYPKENFDFANGDTLYVVKDNMEYSSTRYFINGNYLVLNDGQTAFMKNEMITLIFYYKTTYDMNSLVSLGTQNYANGSITTEKLSPYLELSAEKIDETTDRIFFTEKEREKLAGIEEYATHYVQPETFPATMITETPDRMFISKAILDKLLTTDNGYTKEQVDKMFADIIDGAPDLLNTLKELASAVNNDSNFAAKVLTMIGEKADKTTVAELSNQLDKKVNYTDYVRGGVFDTADKVSIIEGGFLKAEIYKVTLEDSTFENYIDLMKVVIKIKDTNTITPYLQINSLERKSITTPSGESLVEGDLVSEGIYEFRYNGTKDSFILQGKGGVEILDTTLKKYQISANESIAKGNLIDLLDDNTICLKRPYMKIQSISETEQTKFYSNGKVEIERIDYNSALVIYMYDDVLKAKVINLDDIYVRIDDMESVTIASDVKNFSLSLVGTNYLVSYYNNQNILNISHLKIGDESEITIKSDSSYIRTETIDISQLYSITIGTSRLIVIWQVGSNTKCTYFDLSSDVLSVLSTRNNNNYFIDKMCKINDNQIVFGKVLDKTISIWTLNIETSDFSFCDLVENFYTDNTNSLSNLNMFRNSSNVLHITWTDSSSSEYHNANVIVNENGGLILGTITTNPINTANYQSYNITNQLEIEKGYFLSVSNYNWKLPTTLQYPGRECNKIMICKSCDPFQVTDIFSNIFNIALYCDVTFLNDKRLLIVYNDKQTNGDIYHLYFIVCDIIHNPFGVAVQSGIGGDTIRVREW